MTEALQEQLRENAHAMGANYFGVADLRQAHDFVVALGGEFLTEYPFGVSTGVALADGIVDLLGEQANIDVARTYRHHIYTTVAEYLDRIAVRLAFQIEQRGFRALPVPSTSAGLSEMRLQGLVSHKLAANLAGLGWIGKSCMLLTRDHGPRVRWVTVLTDAPLVGAGTPQAERDGCKSCSLCVDLCPAGAFTGIPFKPTEPVEARFDTRKCHRFLQERQRTFGARSCGICVYVCPHGWSMKRKRSSPRTTPALLRERLSGVVSTTTGAA